jgi:uncharacterized metal-binding protein
MAEECCATNGNIMILACSGGSNVGQLSNQAAVDLTQEGFGKMFCLSAKDVPQMVAIDGCDIGCAKAILEHAEVPIKSYLVLTDLGIEKNKDFDLKREQLEEVKIAVKQACVQQQPILSKSESGPNTCCK